jgi:hypothetical protein
MTLAIFLTLKRVVIACLGAGALAAIACADGRGVPTSPSATAAVSGLAATGDEGTVPQAAPSSSASSARSGTFHLIKECSNYSGRAGDSCTVTSSDLKAIEVGSRFVYAQAAGAASLDSDIVLDTPGHGNNQAFGHCVLNFGTDVSIGLCTFSGGTGKFSWFHASARVTCPTGSPNCDVEGTYSFNPRD